MTKTSLILPLLFAMSFGAAAAESVELSSEEVHGLTMTCGRGGGTLSVSEPPAAAL
jgi:hypothetical protein